MENILRLDMQGNRTNLLTLADFPRLLTIKAAQLMDTVGNKVRVDIETFL